MGATAVVATATVAVGSAASGLLDFITDPDFIRPLILAAVLGGAAGVRQIIRNIRKTGETMRVVEQAVTFFGTELQNLKAQTGTQYRDLTRDREATTEQLQAMSSTLTSIQKETHTNSGSSIKDAVIRIEQRQIGIIDDARYLRDRVDKLTSIPPDRHDRPKPPARG